MTKVAAIDIGTNSVRLLILDASGAEVVREMHITKLGQGVDDTGALHPDAIARTTRVLTRYGAMIEQHAVSRVRATATSAARDASNRDVFFALVKECIRHQPELISGDEEARLSFQGATTGLSVTLAPFMVFDIGGGSTEFARGIHHPEQHISVNMGGVRITERFLQRDPPALGEVQMAREHIRTLLVRVRKVVPLDGIRTWLGLAGTVTSFAAYAAKLTSYDANATHGYVLSRKTVHTFCAELLRLNTAERAKLLLEPQRAGVIVGGALVLDEIMTQFDVEQVVTSERDILDGLAQSIRS
jgi:exopolyphosphatase / guanosine-5'-triphosphate,3'-diphosphate pyrophosphatase